MIFLSYNLITGMPTLTDDAHYANLFSFDLYQTGLAGYISSTTFPVMCPSPNSLCASAA